MAEICGSDIVLDSEGGIARPIAKVTTVSSRSAAYLYVGEFLWLRRLVVDFTSRKTNYASEHSKSSVQNKLPG